MDVGFTAWRQYATWNWMAGAGSGAAGTKVFACPAELPDITGDSNIPPGWTRAEKRP